MVDAESFEKIEHIDATNSKSLFFSILLDAAVAPNDIMRLG